METILLFLCIVFCTLCSAFASCAEIAFFSLSSTTVRTFSKSANSHEQRIAALLKSPRELFVTLFTFNIAANILLQNATSSLFDIDAGWLAKVGISLGVVILFGELFPKYIALQHNQAIARAVVPVIDFLSWILAPVQQLLLRLAAPLSRMMFFFLRKDPPISRDEMQHVLETSHSSGILHVDEMKLVSGYLDLQERLVKDLMRPREEMLTYDITTPLTQLTHLFVARQCTRIPVCEGDLQQIKGIITANRYFVERGSIKTPHDLIPFLTPPFFVPESTPVRKLLSQFNQREEEVALAVDEYGQVVGLIAHEDLIEVVTGEIVDQRDPPLRYTRSGEDVIIASGKLDLNELNNLFGIHLESRTHMQTIGGWLTEQLGDLPKNGTQYNAEGLFFQVLAADPKRIRRLYIRRLHPGENVFPTFLPRELR